MESSDAEQSVRWTYSVTAECEPVAVKEEPEGGECGVSEAAVAEGLYAGHVVKDEVVIGPETVQQQDVAFSMQNALEKSPFRPKTKGGVSADCTHACPGDGPHCNRSPQQQHRLRSCFVRLERLPVGDLHRGKPCSSMQADPSASALRRSREQAQRRPCNLPIPFACHQPGAWNWTEEDPCKLQPASGAGTVPECTHTLPKEGSRCNMSHDQQFQLRSCSVRLERILMEDLPTCKTCLVIVDHKSSLRHHCCTHSVEGPNFYEEACDKTAKMYFKCDNCGKQYQKKRHLVRHLATHVKTGCDLMLQHSTINARIAYTEETSYDHIFSKSQSRNQSVLLSHTGEKPSLHRCDICSNMFTRKQDLVKHVTKVHIHSVSKKPKNAHKRIHTGEKPFSCDVCKSRFSQRSNLATHKRTHTGEKPFSCDFCKSRFTKRSHLATHRRIHTGEKPFSCDVCTSRFSQRSHLVTHKRIHTGEKPFSCDVCKSRFSQRSNLAKHKRTHTGEKPFSCDVCKLQFSQRSYLAEHRRTHTGEKPFSCDDCKSRFSQRSTLVTHKRTHTGEKPFSCDVCKLQFSQRSYLAEHRRTHTGEKPFSCDVCESRFTKRSHLATHRRIHTDEKPFSCDVCESRFTKRSHLATHRLIHTGEKPFSCDFCKSQFRHISNLTVHKRIHTGEKPFSCDICKVRFSHRCTLATHKRIHTGEKPFSCDVCKVRFSQRSHLAKHRRIHTGEKPFSCDVCKSRFSQRSNLAVHRRTHTLN